VIYGGPERLAAFDAADGARDGLLSLAHLGDRFTFTEPDPVPIDEGGPDPDGPTPGDDDLAGTAGADRADLLAGDDRFAARGGRDVVLGGSGADTVTGGAGADTIDGGAGPDDLAGEGGGDRIAGGDGTDRLRGAGGADRLEGGRGADTVAGGAGGDTFLFAGGDGADTVADFALAFDTLRLDPSLWRGDKSPAEVIEDHARVRGGDALLDFGDGDRLRLTGVTDLDALEGALAIA
jgi:Ca2+-binding RTX toxin-like protein